MAYFPKNEIEINWCMFGQEVPETLINKGFQRFRLGFNSCRPHQTVTIRRLRQVTVFFCNPYK